MDEARKKSIIWAFQPESEQDIRTFSNIQPRAIYLFAAYQQIMNYAKQLREAKFTIVCEYKNKEGKKVLAQVKQDEWDDYIKINPEALKSKVTTYFDLDRTIVDPIAKKFIKEMLLLSVASKEGNRADKILDMNKHMNRPSNNPLGMLGSMFGMQSNESDALEETGDDSTIEV